MDKTKGIWQMHLQYVSHLYKRVFIDCSYKIIFQSGKIITIKASNKAFPHLVGIDKTVVASHGGSENVFNSIFSGKDFISSTGFTYPLKRKSSEGQKILTLMKFENFFQNIPKVLSISYNKSKSKQLCKLVFNTDLLLIKSEQNYAIGLVETISGSTIFIPNSIMNLTKSYEKYFDNQELEFIDRIEITELSSLNTSVINMTYLPRELWFYSGLILRNNCIFNVNIDTKNKIDNLIKERIAKSIFV